MQSDEHVLAIQSFDNTISTSPGDHDQPYSFGWRPRAVAPFPFSTRQYARLLAFRSRIQDGDLRYDNEVVLRDAPRFVVVAMGAA